MNNYTKFITSKGLEFYYCNETNSLHEVNGTRIVIGDPSLRDDSEYYKLAKENYATRKKHNKPVALRILMGHACNYSCTYCMQKDIGNPNERPKREKLEVFFDAVNKNLNLDNLSRIELWGGEPFLYWNDVMELMTFLDEEGRHFYISTNGSALHPKHADFFSTLKSDVLLNISHDAMHQEELRGEDIFHRARVIETLKMFDKLSNVGYGFTCTVSNRNYDLFEINNYFRNKIMEHGLLTFQLAFSLGRTYVENANDITDSLPCTPIEGAKPTDASKGKSYSHVIHGENLEKFRIILKNFLEAHYKQFTERGLDENGEPLVFQATADELPLLNTDIYESPLGYSVTQYARKTITGEPILENTNCGADMADILSMDLDGNIRTCPHTDESHIYGHLNNIKGIRIISLDMKRKESHCASCHNIKICRSSCPIKLPDEVFMTNCRVEKIWYGEIQKAAFRLLFNDTVEMIETGIDLPYHEPFKQFITNGV
jgi:radical SAM protein with 4Fe4S-binding SPASM domain